MSQAFISYSRRDTEIIDKIFQSLKSSGIEAWLDREDIHAGNSWRLQIVEAIDICDVFVLALSPNSAASENVRKEIDLAQDSRRVVIPILLEPVTLPAAIRYQLAGLQFIDVSMLGFDRAVEQLVATVRLELNKKKAAKKTDVKKVELVIQGVDLSAFDAEKQKQLLEFIANLTSTSQSQVKIAGLEAGSVHAFVEMPVQAAFQLKTFALNRDKRFKQIGVVSLRIVGDASFINIALGMFTKTATIGFLQSLWLKIPFLFFFIPMAAAALIFFWMMQPTPAKVELPPATLTASATSTDVPQVTQTATLTATPKRQTPTALTSPTPDRCSLFENKDIKFTALKWVSGTPLTFYFKMKGGVPGVEDKTVDDGNPWDFSVDIDKHTTKACKFIPGYKERLYCQIDLPSGYSYTLRPLTLTVNGCETPIYENPIAEIPEIQKLEIPKRTDSSCGDNPGGDGLEFSGWCACLGGAEVSGACIVP